MKTEKTSEDVNINPATMMEVFSTADWYDAFLMVVGTAGGALCGIIMPYSNLLFGNVMDKLNGDPDTFQKSISNLALSFTILGVLSLVAGYFQVTYWATAGERQAQKFRERYVRAILSQEIGWFDKQGTSELSTKLTDLAGKIQDGMGRKIGDLIFNLVQFISSVVVSFYLSWKLSLVLLVSIPFLCLSGYYLVTVVSEAQLQALQQYSSAGGLASQTLSAIRTISALNLQPASISQYRKYLYNAMLVGVRKAMNVGLGNGFLYAVLFLTNALGYWYGGTLVADAVENGCFEAKCFTGGDVMAVFFCMIMGSMALGQAVPPLNAFSTSRTAIAIILRTIDRKPLINNFSKEGKRPEGKLSGSIVIENLEFAYPSRPNLLVCKNYSLTIQPGDTIALVGPSGCGKSTVINLLLRFYDPLGGTIKLDGYSTQELNIRWLRSQIGYVGQEPILFSGSIGENIAFGLKESALETNLSREELQQRVVEAAKLAHAHEFVSSLPNGYDTFVGLNGSSLSGGQKQRIAIARALIKKPAILLLDEATSALDSTSERMVQQSIDSLADGHNCTIIVIAHRLSTIRNADRICVINKGIIQESGTHEELLNLNGLYASLISIQLQPTSASPMVSPIKPDNYASSEIVKDRADTITSDQDKNSAKIDDASAISSTKKKEISSKIWGLIFEQPNWFVVGMIGAVIFGGVMPTWGYMLSKTQNVFYLSDPNEIRRQSSMYGLYYILFAGVSLLTSVMEYTGLLGMGEQMIMRLRSDMFEALLRRDVGYFDRKENSVGVLTTALSNDCRLLNKAFSESFARQMQAMCNLIISLILSFSASWKITLIILATFPLIVVSSAIQMSAMTASQYEDVHADDKKANSASTIKQTEDVNPNTIIATAFTHIRTVSALSLQEEIAGQYATATRQRSSQRIERSIYGGLGFGSSNAIQFWIYGLLFWYGAILMKTENLSFVNLMIAIFSLMLGALGLGQSVSDLGDQQEAISAADRIFQCIEDGKKSSIDGISIKGIIPAEKNTNSVANKDNKQNTFGRRIEFKGVSFRYPTRPEMKVCRNYNFVIEPGETVALVGPSGSGKSTIVNLLLRFYDPLQGQILIDGYDIKDLNIRWLRAQIGYVGQEPVLFAGSVAENIKYGRNDFIDNEMLTMEQAIAATELEMNTLNETTKTHFCSQLCQSTICHALTPCVRLPDVDQPHPAQQAHEPKSSTRDIETNDSDNVPDDVLTASRLAYAHDFITTFPQKYDTNVGEGSIMVSGGQKQRIAIARALIKSPSILLLDEATSALDANSELMVQQSIEAMVKDPVNRPTTIIVAHRLTTVKHANKICVVDKGKIVEMGTHEELLSSGAPVGLYRQLWEIQQNSTGTEIAMNSPPEMID